MPWLTSLVNGSGGADPADVVEYFVPKAGVEQVQDGVLGAADVQIDGHPVFFFGLVEGGTIVVGVEVAEVIPATAGPLGHGVGLAAGGAVVDGDVEPVGDVGERRFAGAAGLVVVGFG